MLSWIWLPIFMLLGTCCKSELPSDEKVLGENEIKLEETLNSLIKDESTATANNSQFNYTNFPESDGSNITTNATFKVTCLLNDTGFAPIVEIVNSTRLISLMQVQPNITSQQTPATCLVVLFYSPSCPFSCAAAPHFNALPRVFTDIKMAAVDTSTRYNFNAQYGIVGVPSLLLFHNGRPAARFNSSSDYNLESFVKFITKNTGLTPEGKLIVTSVDFAGPISSTPMQVTDYCLIVAWVFIIVCIMYLFYCSSWYQWFIDSVQNAWREAEAQHHHVD